MKLIQLSDSEAYSIGSATLVSGSALIYDKNFAHCYNLSPFDATVEYLQEEIARRIERIPGDSRQCDEFKFTRQPTRIADIDGTIVPFNLIHPYNYFHFLIESLPSLLYLIHSNFLQPDHVIVSGLLHPNMQHALKLVTENRFQLFEVGLLNSVAAKQAIAAKESFSCYELIDGSSPTKVHYNGANLLALRECFRQRLKFHDNAAQLKLFILRQSSHRNIVNLKELVATAESRGFLVTSPETLSFRKQVELFSSASTIIGPTGAWLANLLFVGSEARVAILYPETCRTAVSLWKRLGDILGIAVADCYFQTSFLNQYQPIHSDFHVDIDAFAELLDNPNG